ncbi:hypothetical protein AB0N17_27780 [Streptomyces sp. NPDC051133]|uniref:effector-associated constant component EACC1 n=1 Tax=Streptomyces sp. NPDC051133 TaxID=3155521 RepID=UPI003439BCDD
MNTIVFEFVGHVNEADELARSLAKWLNDDEDLSGSTRLRMVPPAPGEQGGVADAAEVLSAVGPLLDALVGGLAVWVTERARSRRVSFKVTRPDGTRIELSAGTAQEAAAVQQQMRQFLYPGDRS